VSSDRAGSSSILAGIVLLVGLLGAVALSWWLPEQAKKRRQTNEAHARNCLHVLSTAESDFRANDRDQNGVQDFWTGDVAGLYRFGLIPRGLAEADTAPLVPLVPQPVPYRGYFFRALEVDEEDQEVYRQVTDKASGNVHHVAKFGFVAYPAESPKTGRYLWIINENCTSFRHATSGPAPKNWPADSVLRTYSKVD